jgi:hypothetical protein
MFSFLCQDFYRTWLYIWVTRRVSYKKQELRTLCEHLSSHPVFWCCSSFQFFVLSNYLSLRSQFRDVMSVTISALKTMFGSSLPPVVCRTHVLFIYVICVSLRVMVANTYCVVFLILVCAPCCQILWMSLNTVWPIDTCMQLSSWYMSPILR